MNAILLRGEKLTYAGLAREMGVDYHTAVDRADLAGIKSELRHNGATRAAAAAVRERWGHVTFSALAAELGVEYETAVTLAARARVRSALEEEQAADERVSAFISAHLAETRRYQANAVLLRALHAGRDTGARGSGEPACPAARAGRSAPRSPADGSRAGTGASHCTREGWLYATQVARLWGVTSRLYHGRDQGRVHPGGRPEPRAGVDRPGEAEGAHRQDPDAGRQGSPEGEAGSGQGLGGLVGLRYRLVLVRLVADALVQGIAAERAVPVTGHRPIGTSSDSRGFGRRRARYRNAPIPSVSTAMIRVTARA